MIKERGALEMSDKKSAPAIIGAGKDCIARTNEPQNVFNPSACFAAHIIDHGYKIITRLGIRQLDHT